MAWSAGAGNGGTSDLGVVLRDAAVEGRVLCAARAVGDGLEEGVGRKVGAHEDDDVAAVCAGTRKSAGMGGRFAAPSTIPAAAGLAAPVTVV